jgi:hypothetical protein
VADLQVPDWHVLGDQIRENTTLAPGGNGLATYYEVPYRIDSGPARGSEHVVRVDPRDFTPAQVESLILEHLNNVHGTASLGQGNAGLA